MGPCDGFSIEVDGDRCWVDVPGYGTVAIVKMEDRLSVDVFPFHVVDEPVAHCCATLEQLEYKMQGEES